MKEGTDPSMHGASGGSAGGSWLAYLFALIVLGAAMYAFAHRPLPPFAPTQVRPDTLPVNALAQDGQRIIGVGELGHILIAGDPNGPWHEAKVEPERGSSFTTVAFIGNHVALAGGHDGWIVRSTDDGETWKEVHFTSEPPSDPVLDIAGPFDGKLWAIGAFGLSLVSTDGGKTWDSEPLNIVEPQDETTESSADAAPTDAAQADPFADPFASFSGNSDLSTRHLNGMARLPDDSLLIVGERGLMLHSTDGGQRWLPMPEIYKGSFYGVLVLPSKALVVYGMRGHAFYSHDLGQTWAESKIPVNESLFGGTVDRQGHAVLVGDNNSVLLSDDDGASFRLAAQAKTRGLAAGLDGALSLADGGLMTSGDSGITLQHLDDTASAPAAQGDH